MAERKRNETGGAGAQGAGGDRSEGPAGRRGVPDPELTERPTRRRFPVEYKRRILAEAEAATGPGEIGALLRREGLYSSHLAHWRQQSKQDGPAAFTGKRGPKPDPIARENATLRRRLERTEAELAKARKVIEVQGNVSALLGLVLEPSSATPDQDPVIETPARRRTRPTP